MTTLGSLVIPAGRANGKTTAMPLDLGAAFLELSNAVMRRNLTAALADVIDLGSPTAVLASMEAWTGQDDDAHEPCSLTACRHPLHPGPCKGWKGTLHAVSPHIYRQLEEERVRKANDRRLKRIADLKAQGKPIPRKLLEEIKPKPAPTHSAAPVPLGQVNQKADLAGGQAHHASQAISNAAGVKPSTPLPLGPKQKKPTVAGRGPAFVITQPKVTDQYKLDKAAKITPQEWASLSAADRTAIRNELTAIKARGFGPQQTKADALLAQLPPPSTIGNLTPGTPGTITTPSGKTYQKVTPTPGKVSLGQAAKTISPAAPTTVAKAISSGHQADASLRIAEAIHGKQTIDPARLAKALDDMKAKGPLDQQQPFRLLVDRMANDALKKATADKMPGLGHGANDVGIAEFNKEISDHILNGKPGVPPLIKRMQDHHENAKRGLPGLTPPPKATPAVLPPHAQQARAVAGRGVPKATLAKTHLDAYGKLSKDDFDNLDATTQRTIRDDLANAKGKFLDPKKQQQAQDLLDRFGSRHTAPAPGAPSAPAATGPQGYSDPMNQAVKAAKGAASVDDTLKDIGRLSPTAHGNLTDADKRSIRARLTFIATHHQATPQQKDKAAAFKRIIEKGSPASSTKRDHEPTLSELHADEVKAVGGANAATALKAADDASMPRDDRLAALGGMNKAQFDALTPDDQRKVTDALQELHAYRPHPSASTVLDTAAGDLLEKYTGAHPAIHRMKQAEADFRAGKITGKDLHRAFVRARVQAPGAPGAALEKEADRIARDNPSLPLWVRASLVENKYGTPGGAYPAIQMASNEFNWEKAPRLTFSDISAIFRPTTGDLSSVDPIHAEAIRELRKHIIDTGLAPGSPWSSATKNHVVDNFLHISSTEPEIPRDRIDEYNALPDGQRALVRKVLRDRLDAQTDDHAKTATWLGLRELEARTPLTPEQRAAALAAVNRYPRSDALDAYQHLPSTEYDELPTYTRGAILRHLDRFQQEAERNGPTRTWTQQDNALKVMPAALAAQLEGKRTSYNDRRFRNAADIANYGTKIVNPVDRTRAYGEMSGIFGRMAQVDQDKVIADLDSIAASSTLPLPVRYNALFTRDINLQQGAHLNLVQLKAIGIVHPTTNATDASVISNLDDLTKADFDSLDKVYRNTIDERIKLLPGAQQQALTAKFHPAAPAAAPSGYTPTTVQPNVPPHVQTALDTIYGVHPKSHTMAHQLSSYGALRGSDFSQLNAQEQNHLLSDLSFIATTAKGPSAAKAKLLIDRFTPPGTPSGQVPTPPVIPPANSVPGQVRYATPLKGTLVMAKDKGTGGDGWITTPGGKRVWGKYGAAGLLLMHQDPVTGERRYLMVQRGPAISDPGKWQFPGGAIDSKETFHQGGTREVIEELGFDKDALKDAEVHGEHTNGIPGSNWKYVSVAAQVPKMLKPDLSTHHARAETSDAKWMTEAEIKKLDSDGKLLAPLAGGKLEQNVLSLFPAALPNKLGNVARPGPVTKRQGRLSMPSGGRIPPSQFNAWPHAHKPSKGKDLIPDKATLDAMRQTIKKERTAYDGKTADGRLAAIGAKQGFDDTPTVVDKTEIDRLLATGDYIEAWRGVSGAGGGWSARSRGGSGGKTAAQINEEMRSGPAYYGKGIFGNGYYLATRRSVAEQYSDRTKGSVVRILIPKSALTQKYDKVSKESFASSSRHSKAKGAGYGETSTFWDPGRYAAAKGLDGIEIEPHHISPSGGARHVASPGHPAFNWLNRSVLIIQKEPG